MIEARLGISHYSRTGLLLCMLCVLFGCAIQPAPIPNDPYYAPVHQLKKTPDEPVNGSLYRENVALNLFSDFKANRIGDIINVILDEQTVSNKSANVQILKESEITGPLNGGILLGKTPRLAGLDLGLNVDKDSEFIGQSEADQSNQLQGNISVTVVDTLPNGTLVVRGEKWVTINRGREYIRVSGLVRAQDVNPDNTISSTRLANARIEYSGSGDFAESQSMGWLARFLSSPKWPF